jgi:thioredoxin reductase (NADPH)
MTKETRYDVAVIGAGPAGLSAAIRARWLKSYRSVPCSTVLCDPAKPGGLARLRSTMLTGPSFHLSGSELIEKLEQDRTDLNIPLLSVEVQELRFIEERWHLYSDGQQICSARAAILAPGMRCLTNEAEYFNRGLTLTYNGYDYFPQLLSKLIGDAASGRLVIVGNEKTVNLLPILKAVAERNIELIFLLDEPPDSELGKRFSGEVHFGRVRRYLGTERVEAVEAVNDEGDGSRINCDMVFIDYNAFEIKPAAAIEIDGLVKDGRGFIEVNREGATNLPGLFAAGDCAGLYAMALKALSEGALAGFSAYRYVFQQKFGLAAPLFAYAANGEELDPNRLDYPELVATDKIEVLDRNQVEKTFEKYSISFPVGDCFSVEELQRDNTATQEIVFALLDKKAVTIQPQEEKERDFARRL